MLLAYIHLRNSASERQELCIIPDKLDALSFPVPVSAIDETRAAIYRVGPGETFLARKDPSERSITIEAIKPARVFLTLDRPDQPGFYVQRIKIVQGPDGVTTHYQREKAGEVSWLKWDPLTMNLG